MVVEMARAAVSVDVYVDAYGQSSMSCPRCGQPDGVHIDRVLGGVADGSTAGLAARGEDEAARLDVVTTPPGEQQPEDRLIVEAAGGLRRHFFALVGTCEHCGDREFALIFKQHKGSTMVGFVPHTGN